MGLEHMPSATFPECGRELQLPKARKPEKLIECPYCAGLYLRLVEEADRFSLVALKTASCPICNQMVILPDNAHPGDTIRHCGKNFRLSYEFHSFALEDPAFPLPV